MLTVSFFFFFFFCSLASAAIRGSVTQAELDTFKLYADYTAAAYCNKSPDRVSQKIVCGSDACPLIEAHETTIVATLA